jgi:hypothetical protein
MRVTYSSWKSHTVQRPQPHGLSNSRVDEPQLRHGLPGPYTTSLFQDLGALLAKHLDHGRIGAGKVKNDVLCCQTGRMQRNVVQKSYAVQDLEWVELLGVASCVALVNCPLQSVFLHTQ